MTRRSIFLGLTLALAAATPLAAGPALVAAFNDNKIVRYDGTTGAFIDDFIPSAGPGPHMIEVGPDCELYVAAFSGNTVLRYSLATEPTGAPRPSSTGAGGTAQFVAPGAGGLGTVGGMTFGPDGKLYVSSTSGNRILRFDGVTGAYLDDFVAAGVGGLAAPELPQFGPDGDFYVPGLTTGAIYRFDGTTGAPKPSAAAPPGSAQFVLAGSLTTPHDFAFEPGGNLYGASAGSGQVIEFDGTTGALVGVVAAATAPHGISFGPSGNFYTSAIGSTAIQEFAPGGAPLGTFINGAGVFSGSADVIWAPDGCDHPVPVPDGTFGQPMRVRRNNLTGSQLRVTWDTATCRAGNYEILFGPLSGVGSYTVSGARCSLGPTGPVHLALRARGQPLVRGGRRGRRQHRGQLGTRPHGRGARGGDVVQPLHQHRPRQRRQLSAHSLIPRRLPAPVSLHSGGGGPPMSRRLLLLLPLLLSIVAPAAANEVATRPVVNVGIVFDGPPPGGGNVAPERLQGLVELIESETIALTEREWDVRFPDELRLSGEWDAEKIGAAVDRQLADPEVGILITVGIFSTNEVCRRRELPKPVIAPMAVDIEAQSLPVGYDDEGRITSGVPNLNYLATPGTILRDLRRFREIVPFSVVHVLAEALVPQMIPEIPQAVMAGGQALGAEIAPPLLVVDRAEPVLARLPTDVEAIYITPLHRMSYDEFDLLVRGLNERGIPTFSLIGREEVMRGVMAGVRPETDFARLSRRIALNVQRILLGEDAGDLPVVLELQEKLVINMGTAAAIRVFPRHRTVMEAEQVGGPTGAIGRSLDLSTAVREAVAANLGLRASERSVAAAEETIRRARSSLKPQLSASAQGLRIDKDRAEASFGSQPEESLTAGISLSQLLYSNDALAGLAISKENQLAREADWDAERLDVALDAAIAFLNLLRADTIERINQENLRLTESNLELARRREQIGFSGPADVYRWESALATGRSALLAAHSVVHLRFVELNRLMNRPMEELFESEPPSLVDPGLITGFGRLNRYVDNAASFMLFKEFMVEDGLANAPELRSLDSALAAQREVVGAARRSFWAPEVAFVGEAGRELSSDGAGTASPPGIPADDRDEWSLGIRATLPLYVGGARSAEARQATEEERALRLQRDAVAEVVELEVRRALYAISATYPAIELTREAYLAASKNLELVTDSYARGVLSIIDLIDAQSAALVAEAEASNAEYDFLIDLMRLQRATSRFDFFESDEGRAAWFERLAAYFEENAERIQWPAR